MRHAMNIKLIWLEQVEKQNYKVAIIRTSLYFLEMGIFMWRSISGDNRFIRTALQNDEVDF